MTADYRNPPPPGTGRDRKTSPAKAESHEPKSLTAANTNGHDHEADNEI